MAPKLFVLRTAAERRRRLCLSWLLPNIKELDDKAFSALLRFPPKEEQRRKEHVRRWGLPARLRLQYLGELLALVVEPLPGFVHLVREELVPDACRRFEPYHISLCERRRVQRRLLEKARRRWDGWTGTIPAAYVSEQQGGGYIEVGGALQQCPVLKALHRQGMYKTRRLHISA